MSGTSPQDDQGGWQGSDGDSFTETSTTSWFERIKNALVGLLVGLLLIPVSAGLLFWNEGRAVQTAKSLAEGAASVIAADAARIDPALEGRLVHVSGPLAVAAPPADRDFGLRAPPGTLRLVRRVEMFQWQEESRTETRNNLGGSQETVTTYSYRQVWAQDRIDSGRFRQAANHQNPQPRFASAVLVAPEARIGARRLAEPQLRRLGEERPLVPEAAQLSLPANARLLGNQLYLGNDPDRPRIGDLRITYAVAAPEAASVAGRQAGDGFGGFRAPSGDEILLVVPGLVPAADMFRQAEAENAILTWILRAVGAVVMLVGFLLLMAPMSALAAVVPFIASIIGFGSFVIALLATLLLAPTVIAVAWFFYRPLVAIAVLGAGFALAFGVGWLGRRRAAVAKPRPA
jgi:hypothetical protein